MNVWRDAGPSGLAHEYMQELCMAPRAAFGTLVMTFLSGYLTTKASAVNALVILLHTPGGLGTLANEPERLVTAIDELIRLDPPVYLLTVTAMADTEISGQTVKKGDYVTSALGVANRDPAVFEAPDELRLDRRPNRHLSFGFGEHACLAGRLAKAMITELIMVLGKTPSFRLAGPPRRARLPP